MKSRCKKWGSECPATHSRTLEDDAGNSAPRTIGGKDLTGVRYTSDDPVRKPSRDRNTLHGLQAFVSDRSLEAGGADGEGRVWELHEAWAFRSRSERPGLAWRPTRFRYLNSWPSHDIRAQCASGETGRRALPDPRPRAIKRPRVEGKVYCGKPGGFLQIGYGFHPRAQSENGAAVRG